MHHELHPGCACKIGPGGSPCIRRSSPVTAGVIDIQPVEVSLEIVADGIIPGGQEIGINCYWWHIFQPVGDQAELGIRHPG